MFQRFINDIIRENLDKFCYAHIDDILIYSNNLETYRKHFSWIFKNWETQVYMQIMINENSTFLGLDIWNLL